MNTWEILKRVGYKRRQNCLKDAAQRFIDPKASTSSHLQVFRDQTPFQHIKGMVLMSWLLKRTQEVIDY